MYQTTRGSQSFLSPWIPGIKQPSLPSYLQGPQGCFKWPVYPPEGSSTCPQGYEKHILHILPTACDEAKQSRRDQVYLLACR